MYRSIEGTDDKTGDEAIINRNRTASSKEGIDYGK